MRARFVERVAVACAAEEVWAFVADYGNDPAWRMGVETMAPQPEGVVRVGTTTDEILRLGGRTMRNRGEVLTVEPGRRFEWRTVSGADARGSRAVEPTGDGGSLVTLELEVTFRGAERALGPVLRRVLARTLAGDAARLAASLSSSSAAGRSGSRRTARSG